MSQTRILTRKDLCHWVRLIRTSGVGPVTFFEILRTCHGDAGKALTELPKLAARAGRKQRLRPPSAETAVKEIDHTESIGGRILAACEPDYPDALAALDPPPPVISVLGRHDLLGQRCIAIVGARNASGAGRRIARDMASELGHNGYTVVSGMARGIDGQAHAGALPTGTIAVLAGGIDHIYPVEHENLYQSIRKDGAVLSESPVGYRATGRDFPRRNRIITGLSTAVVIVEAGSHSGSLISARAAMEQGRIVMAVPGSPLDPRSKGVNALLKDGACLVECADDVLAQIDGQFPAGKALRDDRVTQYHDDMTPLETPQHTLDRIAELLSPTPVTLEEISYHTDTPIRVTRAAVAELELAGRAVTLAGGLVATNI